MGLIPTIELDGHRIAARDAVSQSPRGIEKIGVLGNWMVALGAIRLACAVAVFAIAALNTWRLPSTATARWQGFFDDNQPIFLLGSAWPLILGLALRRTRWSELLKAGALTFLILSVGGMLTMLADWGDSRGLWISVGSFHIARQAVPHLGVADALFGLMGVTQLLLEFATAVRAILLAYHTHEATLADPDRRALARRTRFGRLGICLSAALLILMVRLPAGSAYIEVLNQSKWIREFLLRDDYRRIRSARPSTPTGPDAMRIHEIEVSLGEASQAWSTESYIQARDIYRRVISLAESIPEASLTTGGRYTLARAFNGWAWLLATCPDAELRNPQDAVTYARRAIDLVPNDREIWNTLGVAYFRLGSWEEAAERTLPIDGIDRGGRRLRLVLPRHDPRQVRATRTAPRTGTTRRCNGRTSPSPATASSTDSRSRRPRCSGSPSPSASPPRPRPRWPVRRPIRCTPGGCSDGDAARCSPRSRRRDDDLGGASSPSKNRVRAVSAAAPRGPPSPGRPHYEASRASRDRQFRLTAR